MKRELGKLKAQPHKLDNNQLIISIFISIYGAITPYKTGEFTSKRVIAVRRPSSQLQRNHWVC